YTFLAGPGEVVLTVDSGARGSFSQLDAQLFDLDAEKLAQVQNLPYPGETARKVTRASFGAQQPVLLRIFLDREAAQYLYASVALLNSPASMLPSAAHQQHLQGI